MKKITTQVQQHNLEGLDSISFMLTRNTMSANLIETINPNHGDVMSGVRTWMIGNAIIIADDEALHNADWDTPIHFGVTIFRGVAEQLLLSELGVARCRNEPTANTVARQFAETCQQMGVVDWIRDGVPNGIRTIIAYKYNYAMDANYNKVFDKALTIADDLLLENRK